jgi:hypothetical protein
VSPFAADPLILPPSGPLSFARRIRVGWYLIIRLWTGADAVSHQGFSCSATHMLLDQLYQDWKDRRGENMHTNPFCVWRPAVLTKRHRQRKRKKEQRQRGRRKMLCRSDQNGRTQSRAQRSAAELGIQQCRGPLYLCAVSRARLIPSQLTASWPFGPF